MSVLASFDVHGIPTGQGSVKAFAVNGHARLAPSGGLKFAQWRNAVAEAALRQAEQVGCLNTPMRLLVIFRFPMTSGARAGDRRLGWRWKPVAPDADKLLRLVGDALQAGGLVRDDALFVAGEWRKVEVCDQWTGAQIVLSAVTAPVPVDPRQEALL